MARLSVEDRVLRTEGMKSVQNAMQGFFYCDFCYSMKMRPVVLGILQRVYRDCPQIPEERRECSPPAAPSSGY
jgi:hypothetical protein